MNYLPVLLLYTREKKDDEEESDAAVMAAVTAWEEFRQTGMLDALRPNRMAALLHALFAGCVRWEALWPKVGGRKGGREEWFALVF